MKYWAIAAVWELLQPPLFCDDAHIPDTGNGQTTTTSTETSEPTNQLGTGVIHEDFHLVYELSSWSSDSSSASNGRTHDLHGKDDNWHNQLWPFCRHYSGQTNDARWEWIQWDWEESISPGQLARLGTPFPSQPESWNTQTRIARGFRKTIQINEASCILLLASECFWEKHLRLSEVLRCVQESQVKHYTRDEKFGIRKAVPYRSWDLLYIIW